MNSPRSATPTRRLRSGALVATLLAASALTLSTGWSAQAAPAVRQTPETARGTECFSWLADNDHTAMGYCKGTQKSYTVYATVCGPCTCSRQGGTTARDGKPSVLRTGTFSVSNPTTEINLSARVAPRRAEAPPTTARSTPVPGPGDCRRVSPSVGAGVRS